MNETNEQMESHPEKTSPESGGGEASPGRPRKRWIRVLALLALAVAACAAAWFYFVVMSPTRLAALVQGELASYVNGRIEIGSVRLSLFEGVVLDDVRVYDGPGREARLVAQARRVVAAHKFAPLLAGQFVVTGVEVLDAELRVREDSKGRWNVADLLRPQESGNPFPVLENGVWVQNAAVRVASWSVFDDEQEHVFQRVSARLHPLGYSLEQWDFDIQVSDPEWGEFGVKGEFDAAAGSVRLKADADGVEMTPEYLTRWPKVGRGLAADYRPRGRADVRADVSYNAGRKKPWRYKVEVELHNLRATPVQWPIEVQNINGRVLVYNDIVILRGLSGFVRMGGHVACPRVSGVVELERKGGVLELEIRDLELNEKTVQSVPNVGAKVWEHFDIQGRLSGEARMEWGGQTPGEIRYESRASLENCAVLFRAFPIPFKVISSRVEITPEHVKTIDLSGEVCGGRIDSGSVEVNLKTDPFAYKVALELEDVDLKQLKDALAKARGGEAPPNPYEGKIDADIQLEGQGEDESKLTLSGQAAFRDAYVWDSPCLAGILDVLHITRPKRIADQSGTLKCRIENRKILVEHIGVSAGFIELHGKGVIDFDENIDMQVIAGFDPARFMNIPVLTDAVTVVVGAATRRIRKVRVTGTLQHPKIRLVAFRPIQHTFTGIADLLYAATGQTQQEKKKRPQGPAKREGFFNRLNPF